MSRAETTAMLSKLVEKRLKNRVSYWASEVNFDLGTPRNRRIDYIGFKPFTPELADELRVGHQIPRDIDQVLVPTAKGDKLRCLYDVSYGDKRNSYRRRPASEMLYAMIEANGKRTN